jgi:hypothetical protein
MSESFVDDDSRGIFHDAHQFHALYPEQLKEPPRYCAPRVDNGYEFERAIRKIEARAGIRPDTEADVSPLRGIH